MSKDANRKKFPDATLRGVWWNHTVSADAQIRPICSRQHLVQRQSETLTALNTNVTFLIPCIMSLMFVCLFLAPEPPPPHTPVGQGLLIHEVCRSHTTTHHSQQESSDERSRHRDLYLTTHNTHNRQHIHAPSGIRTHDLGRRTAADLRLRPRGHRHGHYVFNTQTKCTYTIQYTPLPLHVSALSAPSSGRILYAHQ